MPFDLKEWNIHSCVCRCLIELQRRRGVTLKAEAIYDSLSPDYPSWAVQPGATDTMAFCRIVREFGIGTSVETFIDAEKVLAESKKISRVGVVAVSERVPRADGKPGLEIIYHGFLIDPRDEGFLAWNPKKDGTHQEFPAPWSTWYQWMMKGFVISK